MCNETIPIAQEAGQLLTNVGENDTMPVMLTTACPDCGLPVPVSLAFPDKISCPGCGYAGHVTAEAGRRLTSAAESLKSTDARLRQLTKRQKRSLESGWVFDVVFVLIATFFLTPAVIFAGLIVAFTLDTDGVSAPLLVLGLAPVVIVVATALFGLVMVHKTRNRLRRAVLAVPAPGDSSTVNCRVCGLTLPASKEKIVRCNWCESDCLVEPMGFRTPAARPLDVGEGFEEEVERRSVAARSAASSAAMVLAASIIAAPLLALGLCIVVAIVAAQIETPALTDAEYAITEIPDGRCVGRVRGSESRGFRIGLGPRRDAAGLAEVQAPELRRQDQFPAQWVVGRRVSALGHTQDDTPEIGVVERVHANLTGFMNYAVINGKDYSVQGLCLVDEETPAR